MADPTDRVAEIRQRLEALTGSSPWDRFDIAWREIIAAAPADLAWLLSRLAVVEAERDELRAVAASEDVREWAICGRLQECVHGIESSPSADLIEWWIAHCDRRCTNGPHRLVTRTCTPWRRPVERRALSGTTEGPS